MKKLLREYFALCEGGVCQDFLTEEEKYEVREGKAFYLTGIMQKADEKNANGRSYPFRILQREVEKYRSLINENRALGECDHPEERSIINLANVSHMVTDIWWDGKTLMGKIKLFNTPTGKTIQELINGGAQIGISSRGLGSVKEIHGGLVEVQDDFSLICFDLVSDPSTTGAFMMVAESKLDENTVLRDKANYLLDRII